MFIKKRRMKRKGTGTVQVVRRAEFCFWKVNLAAMCKTDWRRHLVAGNSEQESVNSKWGRGEADKRF